MAKHFWDAKGKEQTVRVKPDLATLEHPDSCVQSMALSMSQASPKDSDTLNFVNKTLIQEIESKFGNGFRLLLPSRRARYLEAFYYSSARMWHTSTNLLQGHAMIGKRFKAGGYMHSAAVASGSDNEDECWKRGGYEQLIRA